MRRTVFGSTTKFWPSRWRGASPWRRSSSLASRGLRVTSTGYQVIGSPGDADVHRGLAEVGDLRELLGVEHQARRARRPVADR